MHEAPTNIRRTKILAGIASTACTIQFALNQPEVRITGELATAVLGFVPDIRVTAAVFCVARRGVNSAHIVHLLMHAVATLDEQSIVKEVKSSASLRSSSSRRTNRRRNGHDKC